MIIRAMTGAAFAAILILASGHAHAAGALAIGTCGAYGHSYDYPSLDVARTAALRQCEGQCQVVAAFRRQCSAFAFDAGKPCGAHGYATASRLAQAQNVALQHCYRHGGKDCVIRAWSCDGRD